MVSLRGKKAIVTGASSGLGQAIAIAFAKAGADVVFSYQTNQKGAEYTQTMIQEEGGKCLPIPVHLENENELDLFMNQAINFLGGVDILVNNAGALTRHPDFLEITLTQFDLVQAVNIRAPFYLTQRAAKVMIEQGRGGSIINISSASGEVISKGLAHYECSKAAMNMLTKSSASALAQYGIRVNAIAPGLFETNMNVDQHQGNKEVWQKRCAYIPLQKAGLPQDITPLALLLASDEGSLITGDIIAIDGGIGINSLVRG